MSEKAVVFALYFGTVPECIDMFLESICKSNELDVILIGDKLHKESHDNLIVCNMSFESLKSRFRNVLGVAPDYPYKLCDFKPFYGLVFKEEVEGYDFWGYADIDTIFGNTAVLKKLMNRSYDKLFVKGHFSLLRNSDNVRIALESYLKLSHVRYLLSSKIIWVVDEKDNWFGSGLNSWLERYGCNVYTKGDLIVDIDPRYKHFTNFNEEGLQSCLIKYTNERCFIETSDLSREILYVHFHKHDYHPCHFQEQTWYFPYEVNCVDIFSEKTSYFSSEIMGTSYTRYLRKRKIKKFLTFFTETIKILNV